MRTALLAALLVAAGVVGCGGETGDESRYVRELVAAQERYQATARRIEGDATATSTPRQDRRTLERFSAAIAETIATLERIDPPPKVAPEHGRFVAVFEAWHDDVERFATAIENPTRRGVRRAQQRIAVANDSFDRRLRQVGSDIDVKLAS